MSEFHFVRMLGQDGGVDACEGTAIGLDLDSVLKDGLPPFKAALEIVAAMCEIIDIAGAEDSVHGDLSPKFVFLDETGAVSIEGFGTPRKTRAPEQVPKGTQTDLYGLGYTAMRLFSPNELPALPMDDPDAHDDAVIDHILTINFDGMPEEMVGDVQWYLAKLAAFDREDRPAAIDAWRVFIAFADATPGPSFDDWCNAALDGGGERRDRSKASQKPAVPAPDEIEDQEDLGGPRVMKGPLAGGGISFNDGGAPKGQATAFWSKDAMKAALDAQAKDEEEDDGFKPAPGGGAATAFWSADQLKAMAAGSSEAPRPKRASAPAAEKRRAATSVLRPEDVRGAAAAPPPAPAGRSGGYGAGPSAAPPPSPYGGGGTGGYGAQSAGPARVPQQPIAGGPVAGGPVAQGPYGGRPGAMPQPTEAPAGGNNTMIAVIGVVVVLLLVAVLCAGLGGAGAVGAWMSGGTTTTTPAVVPPTPVVPVPTPTPDPAPPVDTGKGGKTKTKTGTAPKPTPKPKPSPSSSPKPSPSPSPSPKPSPSPSPKPSPKPTPAPAPAPVEAPAPQSGPAKVSFKSTGRGKVVCSGNSKDFDGATVIIVEEYQLPATCLVQMGSGKGVFQVYGTGSVTCNESGGAVACDKMRVP